MVWSRQDVNGTSTCSTTFMNLVMRNSYLEMSLFLLSITTGGTRSQLSWFMLMTWPSLVHCHRYRTPKVYQFPVQIHWPWWNRSFPWPPHNLWSLKENLIHRSKSLYPLHTELLWHDNLLTDPHSFFLRHYSCQKSRKCGLNSHSMLPTACWIPHICNTMDTPGRLLCGEQAFPIWIQPHTQTSNSHPTCSTVFDIYERS